MGINGSTPIKERFFLQQTETNYKKLQVVQLIKMQGTADYELPIPIDISATQSLHLLGKHHGKGVKRLKETKNQDIGRKTVPSICDREAALIKSQNCGCLNKTWIMTASVDMPT